MNTNLVDLGRKVEVLSRAFRNSKIFSGVVTNNEDPEGRNRVKAQITDLFGESLETDWLLCRDFYSGNGIGAVFTPPVGEEISVSFRDGNLDAGEYFGGARGSSSTIPEEFSEPKKNGIKTSSGTVLLFNDDDGSVELYTESGGKIFINSGGEVHIYGGRLSVHTTTELNSDSPQFGVVTSSPKCLCPFSGKPHVGSDVVTASD